MYSCVTIYEIFFNMVFDTINMSLTLFSVTRPPPTEAPTLPNSPQNLVADAQAHSARVIWDEPRDNGVPVLGYIITYGPRENPEENILSVDIHPRVTELTGLMSNVQYRLTMTAFNTEGTSIPAILDFFTIGEILRFSVS